MKLLAICAILIFLLSMVSCNPCKAPQTPTVSVAEDKEINTIQKNESTENKEAINVSKLAVEDFLKPFDSYSWEMTEPFEYVVLHFTSAVVLSSENPYDLKAVKGIFEDNSLGIHYIIDRDGKIYCWLPETRAAWHAGKGTFANNDKYTNAMNKYSIGIEMLAIGSKNDMKQYLTDVQYDELNPEFIGYTDAQYESLGKLVRDICERKNISFDKSHVIGHEMYNPSKNDPGELFEWSRLFIE